MELSIQVLSKRQNHILRTRVKSFLLLLLERKPEMRLEMIQDLLSVT